MTLRERNNIGASACENMNAIAGLQVRPVKTA